MSQDLKLALQKLGATEEAFFEMAAKEESLPDRAARRWLHYWHRNGVLHPKVEQLAKAVVNG